MRPCLTASYGSSCVTSLRKVSTATALVVSIVDVAHPPTAPVISNAAAMPILPREASLAADFINGMLIATSPFPSVSDEQLLMAHLHIANSPQTPHRKRGGRSHPPRHAGRRRRRP